MSHEIWASVVVKLPDDAKEMAQAVAAFATAWGQMLQAAGEAQLSGFSVTEGSAPSARVRGHNGAVRRRRRRTRAEMSAAEAEAIEGFPS